MILHWELLMIYLGRKIMFLLWIIPCFLTSSAQTWEHFYGQPGRNDYTHDIVETYDKGYLICGGYSNDWSWLIKTDINGNPLWEKILENDDGNQAFTVAQTVAGGYIIAGATTDGYGDPFVIEINSCGEKEWCKIFDVNGQWFPWVEDVVVTPQDEVILLVNGLGNIQNDPMYLIKLDSTGKVLWKKPYVTQSNYPSSGGPLGDKLSLTSDSGYLITGDVYWANPWDPSGVMFLRPMFVKINSQGDEEWVLPFGIQDTLIGAGFSVIELEYNHYLGVGYAYTSPGVNGLFMKFDSAGNQLDYRIVPASEIDTSFVWAKFFDIYSIDSNYLVGGSWGINPQGGNHLSELAIDTCLFDDPLMIYNHLQHLTSTPYTFVKTSDSKLLNNSTFKGGEDWQIYLAKMNPSLEFDSIYTSSFMYDSLCPEPIQSGFIFLNDCDVITDIDKLPTPEAYHSHLATIPVHIYPNPATNEVTLTLENTDDKPDIYLQTFDILGQEVYKTQILKGQKEVTIQIVDWSPGIYIALITSGGKIVGKGRFIVN